MQKAKRERAFRFPHTATAAAKRSDSLRSRKQEDRPTPCSARARTKLLTITLPCVAENRRGRLRNITIRDMGNNATDLAAIRSVHQVLLLQNYVQDMDRCFPHRR